MQVIFRNRQSFFVKTSRHFKRVTIVPRIGSELNWENVIYIYQQTRQHDIHTIRVVPLLVIRLKVKKQEA